MFKPSTTAYQLAPLSIVSNVRMSIPLVVSVGVVPPANLTLLGQGSVTVPPLVNINLNLPYTPDVGALVIVNAPPLASTAVTILPSEKSIAVELLTVPTALTISVCFLVFRLVVTPLASAVTVLEDSTVPKVGTSL